MKVFIHVGLQKTGTTALQELVFKKLDVNYIRYLDRSIYLDELWDDSPVLISNEDLSGTYDGLNRYQIARNLHCLFPDAHIIVGIRNSASWLRSMYLESVRQGLSMSWKKYKEIYPADLLDFHKYIVFLHKLFPSVYTFNYKDLRDDYDRIVCEICQYMEVPVPAYENKVLNQSIKTWQVPGFKIMNKFCRTPFWYLYKQLNKEIVQ